MSVDPLADAFLSWNPYNYTLNNPMSLTDPSGMAPETIYENSETGEQVEVRDGIDKTVFLNNTDFQEAKFFANELNQHDSYNFVSPDENTVDAYTDFYYEHNNYGGLSIGNVLDYMLNKPMVAGAVVGGAGSLELLGGGGKGAVKPIARQLPRFLVKMQKHHIIPKAVYKKYAKQLAPFMRLNAGFNLKKLPTPFHGNHPQYNRYVGNRISQLGAQGRINEGGLRALQKELNSMINQAYGSGIKLNEYFRKFN